VRTGDVAHAGTSAGVYCVLYGGRGGDRTSGKLWLSGGKLQRARTDLFHVEALELLSPLSRLDVGHDNKGAGPGWFLEEASRSGVLSSIHTHTHAHTHARTHARTHTHTHTHI